ncbi:MAG: 50S ribosomal protein L23 [Miniphocaeibacter sp.]|jgi:large subunit ribosomal protein L23|uniref:50S ribosomal protein L23 n=1 Tax=Miniphocaeibacter sp. TaxID=3100973 RepID=UPI0017A64086|nr:50S ribosomal protein L23 [Gallicola sp.]
MRSPYDIIIKPIITEDSMDKMDLGVYTFKVVKDANKSEIKKAVETVFGEGVKVAKVNTMNVVGKMKRVGANQGKTPNWKKAIVKLTEDSKTIEFFDGI